MDAYIFSHDHEVLKEALRGAMPGVKTRRYRPKHLKAATKKDECKHAITEYLDILEGDSVSKTTLLRNFSTFTPDTKRDALNELLKAELAFDWAVDGRTLVRRKT
jgi:hypothetical protein